MMPADDSDNEQEARAWEDGGYEDETVAAGVDGHEEEDEEDANNKEVEEEEDKEDVVAVAVEDISSDRCSISSTRLKGNEPPSLDLRLMVLGGEIALPAGDVDNKVVVVDDENVKAFKDDEEVPDEVSNSKVRALKVEELSELAHGEGTTLGGVMERLAGIDGAGEKGIKVADRTEEDGENEHEGEEELGRADNRDESGEEFEVLVKLR